MLVKLARNWFAPDGTRYRSRMGLVEIPEGMKDALPTDALIMSPGGTLPSPAPKPQPGFGAKPKHEQVLDQIPYAAPTHQITLGAGAGQPGADLHPAKTPPPDPDSDEARKAREREEAAAEKDRKAAVKEVQADMKEGLTEAKKMEDAQAKASGDPTRKSQIKI